MTRRTTTRTLFAGGPGGVPVEVERKRVRRLNLRVRADGSAHLSVPARCPLAEAQRFLDAHETWLRKHVRRREARADVPDDGLVYPKNELADFYWIEKEDPAEAEDVIRRMILDRIPARFKFDPKTDIQLITPMNRGACGTIAMNESLQSLLNGDSRLAFSASGRTFRLGDRVMQITNNYDKGVFNGDMGRILAIRHSDSEFIVRYDANDVTYAFEDAEQLTLAYAVTIHKSQGSEFPVVIVPILPQHYMMLQRNLLYTGMTRAKKLMVLVGSRKAVSMAVRNAVREPRHSLLRERLADAFRGRGAIL